MRSGGGVRVVAPGGLIGGRYRLIGPLGAGASATVWAAADETLGRQVALKVLGGMALDEDWRDRLRGEARALAALDHPHIVVVFDYLETLGVDGAVQPVLVTELLKGHSLGARLEHGPLPWPEASGVCGQLAGALAAAHQAGIVHRDVKPANVMLTAEGVKLLDFGIAQGPARAEDEDGLAVGTPMCMAPEQLTGDGAVPASDVYALGCLLHWCLTGRPPFTDTDLAWLNHAHLHQIPPPLELAGLPPAIDALRLSCLAKDPAVRPATHQVAEFLAPFAREDAQPTGAGEATRLLPAVADAGPRDSGTAPRGARRHAGHSATWRDRRLVPAGLVVAALGVVALIMLGLAHMSTGGAGVSSAGTPSSGGVGTGPATALSESGDNSVVLPGESASALPSTAATHAPSSNLTAAALPALSASVSDPIAYLQGLSIQIQVLIARGPATLQAGAGRTLRNSVADAQTAVASGQESEGKKLWRNAADAIDATRRQIASDASAGQISSNAASLLDGELQRLAAQLPTGRG